MRRVGVFGGTFDPVHVGHVRPCLVAQETFAFDAVILVPAGRPPHKEGERVSSFAHRFAMLVLATQDHPKLLVSDMEMSREGPSYTFDTLRRWQDASDGDDLYFLMGSDSFAQITTWHRWQELADLANVVVFHRQGTWGEELANAVPESLRGRLIWTRPGGRVVCPASGARHIFLLDHEPVPASATDLRRRLGEGAEVAELISPEVQRYIVKYGLYGSSPRGYDGS